MDDIPPMPRYHTERVIDLAVYSVLRDSPLVKGLDHDQRSSLAAAVIARLRKYSGDAEPDK